MATTIQRLAGVAVVVSAICGGSLFAIRRQAESRLLELHACLLGEPLDRGELASDRYLAIELARPPEKMKLADGGFQATLVPRTPIPSEERWPTRCKPQAYAAKAVPGSWLLGKGMKEALTNLAWKLDDGLPPDVDSVFREDRVPKRAADKTVRRPWAPVMLLPKTTGRGSLEYMCAATSLLSTLDHWDDDLVLVQGCAVTGSRGGPLSAVRLRTPEDRMRNADHLLGNGAAQVNGGVLRVDGGVARFDRESFGPASEFRTCSAGATRVALIEHHESADVRFIDAATPPQSSARAAIAYTTPEFSGHEKYSVTQGPRTVTCTEHEARVAWSWSTLIDQVAWHEIFVARCTPGSCEVTSTHVQIDTPRFTNCGSCALDPNLGSAASPTVIDLFGSIAVVWTDRTTTRARIAPLDELRHTRDLVLWHSEKGGWFEPPRVITRGPIALVGSRIDFEVGGAESRLYRFTSSGARELTPPL